MKVHIYSVCDKQNQLLAAFLEKSQAIAYAKNKWGLNTNREENDYFNIYKQIETPTEIIHKLLYVYNGCLTKIKQEEVEGHL